jgi:hypothetical protein
MLLMACTTAVGVWVAIRPVFANPPAETAPPRVAQDTVEVDAPTESTIHGALRFLANQQTPSGSFVHDENHQAALTAYALIAFMSAGEVPGEGEFGHTVTQGENFLLECCRPDGYIAAPTGENNMYGHGIATICLAEMYGESTNPALRPKLERAIKLIVSCQNQQGGWRYPPKVGDADLSVTVLQVVALRAAKNAGIDVPQTTIDRAVAYVKSCRDPDNGGGFDYQPNSQAPGFARTAAAIYSLQVCGLYNDPMVPDGSDYLRDSRQDGLWQQYFTYGNFYAAPAQYMIGGDTWTDWYTTVHNLIMANKITRGDQTYWEPLDGGAGVNEVYATSVYTMILSMPFHYIPLYQR